MHTTFQNQLVSDRLTSSALALENDFLSGVLERKAMIEHGSKLPVTRQAKMLGLSGNRVRQSFDGQAHARSQFR